MSKLKLYLIYGYETKDTKLEDRILIYKSYNYSEISDIYNLLLNLQLIEDVSYIGYDSKDGYALVHSCLDELKEMGVVNVSNFHKFKLEQYTID